jgi:hypothetical protein
MNTQLQKAFSAIQTRLSEEEQESFAHEILEELEHYSDTMLTPEQAAIVKERLSQPMEFATPEEVERIFSKYRL